MPFLLLNYSLTICFRSSIAWCKLFSASLLRREFSSYFASCQVFKFPCPDQVWLLFLLFSLCRTHISLFTQVGTKFLLFSWDLSIFSFVTNCWFSGLPKTLACSWAWIYCASSWLSSLFLPFQFAALLPLFEGQQFVLLEVMVILK